MGEKDAEDSQWKGFCCTFSRKTEDPEEVGVKPALGILLADEDQPTGIIPPGWSHINPEKHHHRPAGEEKPSRLNT